MYNLLCSINFLHSSNIMHRNIKPGNILIDNEGRVKLCDLGFARTIPENKHYDDMNEFLLENALSYFKAFNVEPNP